jgi:hypothetical protein
MVSWAVTLVLMVISLGLATMLKSRFIRVVMATSVSLVTALAVIIVSSPAKMKAQGYGPVGPIINGVWDLRDPSQPPEAGYIIEDMGYPGVLGEVCSLLGLSHT